MNVAWCVMALALTGNTDEPRTSESAVCGAHPANTECQEIWPMSLSAATCIALDNSNLLRVVTEVAPSVPGGGFEPARVDPAGSHADDSPIVVARIDTSESIWRFKWAVMALVRSVELTTSASRPCRKPRERFWRIATSWSQDQKTPATQSDDCHRIR
jgi:hypothetical protein